MKVLDLFSGIGGFSLGLERAGMETVAFCEIEDYPRKILKKHWPDVPIYKDVRELDGKKYRNSVDVVCGGFPCQPFSVAGKQRGIEDDRHLWPEMLRIIKEVQPTWVIGENVAGFIRMALDDVLLDLETEGYTTQSFVIPACAVGAIHRRDRVWIIGHAEHNGRDGTKDGQSNTQGNDRDKEGQDETIKPARPSCEGRDDADTEHSKSARIEQHSSKILQKQEANGRDEARIRGDKARFKPLGLPAEPPVRHRDDGFSDNVARLKALGNAVVPQIPELIGRAIIELQNE